MVAATHACQHELYRDRYQQTQKRLGKQRGAKVAQVDLVRLLAEAIRHMLTRHQPFAPAGATRALAAQTALPDIGCATGAKPHTTVSSPRSR